MTNNITNNYILPDNFTINEKTLFTTYINEYNDIYPHISLMPSCEFLQNVIKRVEITLTKKD